MKNDNLFKSIRYIAVVATALSSSCGGDDPQKEDTPELITKATLTFSPVGGGSPIVVSATDPDGEGVQNIKVDGAIQLSTNKEYTLAISLINELAKPTDAEYNLTEEVEEEGNEHMFFFAWTNNVFVDPTGNGNIDQRSDVVNYEDVDDNNLPLGLHTRWKTVTNSITGKFRVVLKHQPDQKSSTSGYDVGETDLDIEFILNVQ